MPDNEDYRAFFDLLEHPERWSGQDRRLVAFTLEEQRHAVQAAHPKDQKRRADLQGIVEQIESAIAAHDNLRSFDPPPGAGA